MGSPFISVIIPCLNVGHCIQHSVMSVVNQTFKDFEIICVDNNSSDDTWERLCELKNSIPSLIVVKEPKQGACSARNKGLTISTGKWVQFLDADDILLPHKFNHQVRLLENKTNVLFVAGSYRIVRVDGEIAKVCVEEGSVWEKLLDGSLGCTISNLFDKTAIQELGGWDESQKSSQEFKLMFDLLRHHPDKEVVFDREIASVYQKRGEGSISFNERENIIRYIELRVLMWQHISRLKIEEVSEKFYLNTIFQKIRILYRFDRAASKKLYKELIPSDFTPNVSALTPKHYIMLYKTLGFNYSEKVMEVVSGRRWFKKLHSIARQGEDKKRSDSNK